MFINTESVLAGDKPLPKDDTTVATSNGGQHPPRSPAENGVPKYPQQAGNAEGGPMASFRKRHRKPPAPAKTLKAVLDTGVNLRDVGAAAGGKLRPGALFRSSELLGKKQMEQFGIKTILDLRRMDRPCKNSKDNKLTVKLKTGLNYLLKGPNMVVPDVALPYKARAFPKTCVVCSGRFEDRYGIALAVQHADLIPGLVGFRIFQAMPKKVRFKAILAGLRGQGAASVMAPAVANPLLMGYKALYRTMLEDSKRGIARAVRVFAAAEAFPVLVHCIHGKDRTGLVIALLLMLCDVDSQVIVDDYVQSEAVLKASRMHHELDLDVYLTTNDVIAATRDTMEDTITYINEKYGSARRYLKSLGLERGELSQIRINLMQQAEVTDLLARKRPARPSIARPSRIFPRHSSISKPAPPSTVLPPTKPQTVPELPRQSVRVPGEEADTTLQPRPKSADLGLLAHDGPSATPGHRHSLSASASPREAALPPRHSMFARLSRSVSGPERGRTGSRPSIAVAAISSPRAHSPTGGRFSAGWGAAPAEDLEVAEEAEAEGLPNGLSSRRSSSLDAVSRGPRRSDSKRLSRPSRRFEDLDQPPITFEHADTPEASGTLEPSLVRELMSHMTAEDDAGEGGSPQSARLEAPGHDVLPMGSGSLEAAVPQKAVTELHPAGWQPPVSPPRERDDVDALVQHYAPLTQPGSSVLQVP